MRVFVAADRFTGDPIDVAEPVHPTPHQHGVNRRRRNSESTADLHRPQALPPPQPDDLSLDVLGRAMRARTWPARPIDHPRRTFGPKPRSPLPGRDR